MEAEVKGYMVQCAARLVLDDPLLSARTPPALLETMKRHQTTLPPSGWVDRRLLVDVARAIAAAHAGDEESARRDLLRCGRAIGVHATGTFLRLILKVLTPRMFAAKLPDLFLRDHRNSGRLSVESCDAHHLELRVAAVDGYDHIGVVGLGFIGNALAATGVKNLELKLLSPWSLAEPAWPEIHLIATWQ